MLNRVILIGRLTRDPELRYTSTGIAVTRFTIACDRKFTNQNGDREADFIPVVAWRGTAEAVANYTRKGSLVGLEGRLQVRSYENQEGRTVWTTEVVADDVRFLDYRNKNESDQQPQQTAQPTQRQTDPFSGVGKQIELNDDDFPW